MKSFAYQPELILNQSLVVISKYLDEAISTGNDEKESRADSFVAADSSDAEDDGSLVLGDDLDGGPHRQREKKDRQDCEKKDKAVGTAAQSFFFFILIVCPIKLFCVKKKVIIFTTII